LPPAVVTITPVAVLFEFNVIYFADVWMYSTNSLDTIVCRRNEVSNEFRVSPAGSCVQELIDHPRSLPLRKPGTALAPSAMKALIISGVNVCMQLPIRRAMDHLVD
jgi:hypothetical protein